MFLMSKSLSALHQHRFVHQRTTALDHQTVKTFSSKAKDSPPKAPIRLLCHLPYKIPLLLDSKSTRPTLLGSLILLLVSLFKCRRRCVASPNIVKILDFVDTYDPIFAGKRLLKSVEDRSLVWQPGTTNTVLCLSWWKQRVVVVVRHFVPRGEVRLL